MNDKKIYAFDLDGTLCDEMPTFEKSLARPYLDRIIKVNKLYDGGNTIIIFTARGWQEYNMTKAWLDEYGVKYHQLICGKPIYHKIIDDRSWDLKEFDQ